jgi:hypothetical protein
MFHETRPRRPRQFEEFTASELWCPRCRRAMPVRSRLLLVLPDGELHEYLCMGCAASVGTKTVRENRPAPIFIS